MNLLNKFPNLKNRYFVLRHGESEANTKQVIVSDPKEGIPSYGLTPEGQNRVRKSVEEAVAEGKLDSSTIIISSDFKRTQETAKIAKEVIGTTSDIILSPKLRERHFGDWDLKHNSNYQKVWDDDVNDAGHKNKNVESTEEVLARATSLIQDLENEYSGKNILLVSHGDTLQILQTGFNKTSPSLHRNIPHLETSEIRELLLK